MPAIPILARFRDEGSHDVPVILGLDGGILEGRRLVREPVLEQFEADPDLAGRKVETFGQRWWLSDF